MSSLDVVFERIGKRAGVLSVTLCSLAGLVVQSTLEEQEAHSIASQFAKVVNAAQTAHEHSAKKDAKKNKEEKDPVEVVTVRSAKAEWIVTLADASGEPAQAGEKAEYFFVVARDPTAK